MTRNETLRVSVRCEHVPLLKPQISIVNTLPPAPKRKVLRTDVLTVRHKYLYIDRLEGIFVWMYPAVQSCSTDDPGINASPLMSGGLHYPYSQTPTLHHPHLQPLKHVNRNSLLHNVSVYCHLQHTATPRCVTSRKVAGSIPDGVIGIFHSHNPSGRTMALG